MKKLLAFVFVVMSVSLLAGCYSTACQQEPRHMGMKGEG